ncbi:MAG: DctP family TRAP transporter solute-binding subunit [Sphaerochaeta sp.]|jgi:tripartite ATP-independent transporter DctP family solute receptor
MKRKPIVLGLIVLFVASALLFSAGVKEAGEQETFKITFTTASVPEEAHTKVLVEYVAPRLAELTNGRVTMDVFSSGSLFSQDDELPATIRGNATMCYTDGTWLSTYMPSTSMFSAGYIFKDLDHMNNVLNGAIGKKLFEDVAQKVGVRPLASYYIGSRSINLRNPNPAMTPADLRGVKLRMPNSEAWLMLGKALGANPTPVDFSELYTALATGTVDGQDNPLTATEEAKFYEVTKSISLTAHQIGTVWPAINEKFWQSLGPELQPLVLQAFVEGIEYNNEIVIEKEAMLVDYFRSQGLTVVTPNIDAFKKQVNEYYLRQTNFIKDWDMDLFDEIARMSN